MNARDASTHPLIQVKDAETLLSVSGLCKSYAAPVLLDVALELRTGEVHALVGENGAGKTTLARIVSGLTRPDRGSMLLQGHPYAPASKHEAERAGVRMVMQELNLIPNLTAAENIFLGSLPRRFGVVSYRRLHAAARQAMARVGLSGVPPERPVRELGVGQQQLVEIAAALAAGHCALLILDEPTAALTDTEVALLFRRIRELREAGAAILYISHRLEEIQQIADRITVLRDGRVVATRAAPEARLDEIIRLMVGRDLGTIDRPARQATGRPALRVEGLCRGRAVQNVSFTVHEGEILGLAGLMGSGRTETLRAVFGADRPDAGAVYLHGATAPARIRSPRDAVRLGIAFLPEDRKQQGLLLPLAVRCNITLAALSGLARWGGVLRAAEERAVASRLARLLSIQCRSVEQTAAELSGGNQQKAVIARWLLRDCGIVLFDEPTRGVDVGAKFEIYRLLSDLAERGKAIVAVSSDLLELMHLCDRIAVMSAGRMAAVFQRGEWTQDKIMAAALSGYGGSAGGQG